MARKTLIRIVYSLALVALENGATCGAADTYTPVADFVDGKAFGFRQGESRVYRRMNDPQGKDEIDVIFLRVRKEPAQGTMYDFRCLAHVNDRDYDIDFSVSADGFPRQLVVKAGTTKIELAFGKDSIAMTGSQQETIEIPAKHRADYATGDRFVLVLGELGPVTAFIPALYMLRDGARTREFTAFEFGLKDDLAPYWYFTPVKFQRTKQDRFKLPSGKEVVGHHYEASLQSSHFVAAKALVDDQGIVYEAGWADSLDASTPKQWGLMGRP